MDHDVLDLTDDTIDVLIVEDHQMVADGLAEALSSESDLRVVGTAATMTEALTRCNAECPDVVIMDYRLPDGDGVTATRILLAKHPEVRVIMVTSVVGEAIVTTALEAGCVAFLVKNSPLAEVIDAVRSAARGDQFLSPARLDALTDRMRSGSATVGELTAREQEVLLCLSEGIGNREIADRLYVSLHTVRNHVQNIIMKLGAHSKLEAVAIAARNGLIDR